MFRHGMDLQLMVDDVRLTYERHGFRSRTGLFCYDFPQVSTTGPGSLVTSTIALDGDSIFVWCGMTASFLDSDHNSFPNPDAAVFLGVEVIGNRYRPTGKYQMPWTALTGSAHTPHLFAVPYLLGPGEDVRTEWIHHEEPAFNAQVTLIGAKLWTDPYTERLIYPEHDDTITFGERAS